MRDRFGCRYALRRLLNCAFFSAYFLFKYQAYSATTHITLDTIQVAVKSGWNLISVPLRVADNRVASLFPSAVTVAFGYEKIYFRSDSLLPGRGYWMKFTSPEMFTIIGTQPEEYSTQLRRGWNLVGSSWTSLSRDQLDVDPCDAQIAAPIYIYDPSTGYRSTDTIVPGQGAWVKANEDGVLYEKKWYRVTDLPLEAVLPHPLDPGILFGGIPSDFSAGTVGAFVKSTDWGASWDTILANVDAGNIILDPNNPNVMYAGLGSVNTCKPGILKSTDGGVSWFRADDGIVQNLDCFSNAGVALIDPNNDNVLYATAGGIDVGSRVYRSSDGGAHWTQLSIYAAVSCVLQGTFQNGPLTLSLNPQNSNNMYAGTEFDSVLYWSTDAGDSWSIRHCFGGPGTAGISCVHVDPTDSDKISVGARGFFRSVDRGETWDALNIGLENLSSGVRLIPTQNPDLFYSQIDSCFFRTSNGGLLWERVKCDSMITLFRNLDEAGHYIYISTLGGVYRMRVSLHITN